MTTREYLYLGPWCVHHRVTPDGREHQCCAVGGLRGAAAVAASDRPNSALPTLKPATDRGSLT